MADENDDIDALADYGHKRAAEPTEKSMEERSHHYINARRGKLRMLTNKSNEMDLLMENNCNLEKVKSRLKVLQATYEDFKECNSTVLLYLHPDEINKDQEEWFYPKEDRVQEFIQKTGTWINDAELEKEKSQAIDEAVTHMESVSMVSQSIGSKSGSGSSRASSARLKEEAKRAALEAKAAVFKQKQALALKEVQLSTEKEELELKTALAVSNAKIKIYEEYGSPVKGDPMNEYVDAVNLSHTHLKKELAQPEAGHRRTHNPIRDEKPPDRMFSAGGARSKEHTEEKSAATSHRVPQQQSDTTKDIFNVIKQQADITELLVKNQNLARLPKRDIPVFSGDPLDFRSFLKAFEHTVDSRTDNNADKLYFLEQYTRGEPQDLVKVASICQHTVVTMKPCKCWLVAMATR